MDNMNTSCFPLALAALKGAKSANERIDNLPLPMVFKGTLGTGGTIETLPAASSDNVGYVYIVITDGTYSGQVAKAGDLFVSDGSIWVLVPSADEPMIKSFTYTGTGEADNTITFPINPTLILTIQGDTSSANTWQFALPIIFGVSPYFGRLAASNGSLPTASGSITYSGKTMTLSAASANNSFNVLNKIYYVYYI